MRQRNITGPADRRVELFECLDQGRFGPVDVIDEHDDGIPGRQCLEQAAHGPAKLADRERRIGETGQGVEATVHGAGDRQLGKTGGARRVGIVRVLDASRGLGRQGAAART